MEALLKYHIIGLAPGLWKLGHTSKSSRTARIFESAAIYI
jgi:hypothetical protein